jgi:hypothetical protein
MSNIPNEPSTGSTLFAIVVDGEVAWLHGYDNRAEQAIAAMSSDPKVVLVSPEDFDLMVPNGSPNYDGWTYANGVFSPPA